MKRNFDQNSSIRHESHKICKEKKVAENRTFTFSVKKATITVNNIDRFQLFISTKPSSSAKVFHKELESTEESTLQSHTVSG